MKNECSVPPVLHAYLPFIILQIQLKDLLRVAGPKKTTTTLKGNSLMELMKLKPPLDIAQPVATATATGHRKNRNMGLTATPV